MAAYTTQDIRNFTFVGHGDASKTSLVETILFKTGATTRLGSVADNTSNCDFEPEEKDKKISIDAAVMHTNYKGKHFNIIDAPGYGDFSGEAFSALAAVETAFVCVNASSGVMVNTRKMWDAAADNGVARAILVNKLDLENINLDELLAHITDTFGSECHPVNFPDGTGPQLTSITSMLATADKALPHMKEKYAELREKLVETVVESDDAVMERYLEGKPVTPEEINRCLTLSMARGKLVPVLFTSAKKDVGVQELIEFIAQYLPSPADFGPRMGTDNTDAKKEKSFKPVADAPFSARVFKSLSDPFVGKLTFFRVYSGSLGPDSVVFVPRTGKQEKVAKVFKVFGKDHKPAEKLIAGDIGTVTKIEDISVSDTLCTHADPIVYPPVKFPHPMVSVAVEPKSRTDEQKISQSLLKIAESDPSFKIMRDKQTAELVITGMSNLHLDVILARLKRKFDVSVTTKQPKIPFLETVMNKAESHYKHKKQTGGRGQFGEVYLKIEPMERGKGFEFGNEIFGGSVPTQYVPAIEKGVKEVMEKGVIAGYPMVDIKAIVYDGSYHAVDSDEHSFKIAGARAFAEAVKVAKPVLLEPVVVIEVTFPSKKMGEITASLIARRGRIQTTDMVKDQQIIRATIPLSEIQVYSTELQSMTGGEGHYTVEPSHYDVVPMKVQEAIVAKAKVAKEEED